MTGTPWPKPVWPRAYDLVWTQFPQPPDLDRPGPKSRPCLVIGVYEYEDDEATLLVAPGTTNLKQDRRPFDFYVTNWAEMRACGLSRATRFDIDDVIPLPYWREFFTPLNGMTSPVMGRLSSAAVMAFQSHMAWREHELSKLD